MHRTLTLCAFALLPFLSPAQFGPHNFAFNSEVNYPGRILAGDVDMDGDVDAMIQLPGSGGTATGVYLWRNQGAGTFGDREWIYAGFILNNGDRLKVADVDNDGDGDLIVNANWYRNNGIGLLFTAMGTWAPAGTSASGLLKDLDGDGDVDDIGRTATSAVILLNNGSGTYSIGATLGPLGSSSSIAADLGNLNGDLFPDLVIGGVNTQSGFYPGLGGGAFGARDSIPYFGSGATPDLGDMDNDGDVDLLAFGAAPGLRWWSNDGLGVFTLMDTVSSDPTRPEMVGDVDGDGDLDLSQATGTSCNVRLSSKGIGLAWSTTIVEDFGGYSLQGTRYAAGDLDGDGDQDLLFCHGLGMAAWYPNNGGGVIGPRKRLAKVLSGGRDVAAADVDLDGDLDLAAASYYADFVTLYLNNGDGTFGPQQVLAENRNGISRARFADLDVDGKPDLITNVASCAVIWNNGGSWSPDTLPGQSIAGQAMDVDGDLDIDLVCTGKWLQNDGSGNFTPVLDADIPAFSVADTADVNGDGTLDIVVAISGFLSALLNDGSGDFTVLNSPATVQRLDLADMDGDGDVDVAAMGPTTQVYIFFNDGVGNFTGALQYDHPVGITDHILAADIDGDDDVDVIWAHSNGYQHETYVHRNLGPGVLGPAELIDPSAEVTMGMILADMNNDVVLDLVHARFHSISWKENFYYNAFRLRGSVFKDFDLDAFLDPTDQKVPFQLVRTDANGILVWTNSAGDYDLPADTGTWDVWTNPPSIYQITNNPDTLTATLTVPEPIEEDLDFGMAPAVQDTAGFLSLVTSDFLRCNTDASIWITVQNTGTFIPEDLVIDFTINPDVTYNGASIAPDSIVGDHYYWHVDSLGWFESFQVAVFITTGPAGSSSYMHAAVIFNAAAPIVYTEGIGAIVNCALDPNDKLVTPEGYGPAGAVDIDTEWLTYTVRFQNTGNDTAFTVVLRDTLDADLDWASMQILAASHDLTQIMVDEGGLATFRFDQILLPDSNVNEPLSHGFVKYRIAPVDGAPDGTVIDNSAAIYFDLNAPVITNMVMNTLVDCDLFSAQVILAGVDSLIANAADVYQWFLDGDSITGANSQWLNIAVAGNYSVEVTSIYGCVDVSDPFQVISTSVGQSAENSSQLVVMPNPADGDFTILCPEALDAGDAIEIVDVNGRVVLALHGYGTHEVLIERGDLGAGMYLVRIVRNGSPWGSARVVVG